MLIVRVCKLPPCVPTCQGSPTAFQGGNVYSAQIAYRWAAPIADISGPCGAKNFMPALRSGSNEREVYTPDLSSGAREVFTFDVSHLTFDVSHLTFEL